MAKPVANDIDRQIGLRLKKLRQQEGVSAATLAEAIGSTQQQISRYENAQNKISASQLYLLAQSLSVPLAWFFLDTEAIEPSPLLVSEKSPPQYVRSSVADETATLQAIWPRLNAAQRSATLKLLDSFLE
ncbi:MAG: XRE family transcriptional regulator [Gammaproteobacteria bacterium]|nr:MAG: XRE family transcriptional regulator [Gammaproteobacteria bacterium]